MSVSQMCMVFAVITIFAAWILHNFQLRRLEAQEEAGIVTPRIRDRFWSKAVQAAERHPAYTAERLLECVWTWSQALKRDADTAFTELLLTPNDRPLGDLDWLCIRSNTVLALIQRLHGGELPHSPGVRCSTPEDLREVDRFPQSLKVLNQTEGLLNECPVCLEWLRRYEESRERQKGMTV